MNRTPFSLALAFAATVVSGCGGGTPVVDRPDATLPWTSHRTSYAVPDGGMGLVSNSGSDQVSLLDLASTRTMATVRVGISPLGNDGPHHLAVDPENGRVFVALSYPPPGVPSGPHAGHGASTVPGWVQSLALSDLHEIARHEVDPNPGDIVVTPDHRRVLVTHFNLAQATMQMPGDGGLRAVYSNLWVLDAADLSRVASVPICVMAHGIVVSDDGRRAYVACNGQDALAIVHLDDPAYAVELVPVGPGATTIPSPMYGPYAVLLTRDQTTVVVSDREGRDLRVFDIATHAFDPARTVRLGSAGFFGAESPDGRFFLFAAQAPDVIVRVRRSDWQVEMVGRPSADDCVLPHEISLGPDGRFYLVCEERGTDTLHSLPSRVNVVDPMSLAITAHFDVGVYPDRVVFVPAGGGGRDE